MAQPAVAPRAPLWAVVLIVLGMATVPLSLLGALLIDHQLAEVGRSDLRILEPSAAWYVFDAVVAAAIGAVLCLRHPRNPIGWLFLALSVSINVDGVAQDYAAYGVLARPGSWRGADQVMVVESGSWRVWFVLIALVLLLTPTGRPVSSRWRAVVVAAPLLGALGWIGHVFRPGAIEQAPFEGRTNPLSTSGSLGDVFTTLGLVGSVGPAVCLLLGGISLITRFRRAQGDDRRQLLWLALVVIPLPVVVVGSFVAAATGQDTVLDILTAGFVLTVPVAAGLSVARYRLYDVDRILSRAAAYAVLTVLLIVAYTGIVLFVVWSLRDVSGRSQIATAVATLATAAAAVPVLRRVQDTLDRRFSRRRFEAHAVLRAGLTETAVRRDPQALLRRALGDDTLRIAYAVEDAEGEWAWSTAEGEAVAPDGDEVVIHRDGRPVASIAFDPVAADRELVDALAGEAAAELENVALRAAVARRLDEVRASRARLVEAQLAERHRIERNLHDGAQQRLLALAFRLRAAQLRASGTPDGQDTAAEFDVAVTELQAAVGELRALANGLHPTVLTDGGLSAALEDLASRTPVTVRLEVTPRRFPPAAEAAAWFVACEAVSNAVKHARPRAIQISARDDGGVLRLEVRDDGNGGADPDGPGLRGLADRAEAAGGRLLVVPGPHGQGTEVRLELPCAS